MDVVKRINVEENTNFSYSITNGEKESWSINNGNPQKIWHRRWHINFLEKLSSTNVYNYLKKEADIVVKSSELFLKENIEYVGSFIKESENYKPYQLSIAKKCGLKIPETLITNNKNELLSFYNKHKNIISKDLRYPVNISLARKRLISTGTIFITEEMIEDLNRNFAPMLFQKYVEKEYEVRVFFFKEDYYPMAIFSQKNEKTKIDFRNDDKKNPNRCVPVILPATILEKLKLFSKTYDLNTGSIDLIKTTKGEYVFLEINPQGQLDWVSKNCNYYIEKRIANFFTNE